MPPEGGAERDQEARMLQLGWTLLQQRLALPEQCDPVRSAFDEPGEYAYYCTLHGTETAGMVGTIRVVD